MFGIFKRKKKVVAEPINREIEEEVTQDTFHYYMERDMEVSYPLYIGSRIICVSNQNNSLKVGEIVAFDRITQGRNIVPLVKFDGDDAIYTCLGTLLPYDDDMYNVLKDLDERNDKSAWNFVAPSWCQLDDGEIFKETKDSVRKEVRSI